MIRNKLGFVVLVLGLASIVREGEAASCTMCKSLLTQDIEAQNGATEIDVWGSLAQYAGLAGIDLENDTECDLTEDQMMDCGGDLSYCMESRTEVDLMDANIASGKGIFIIKDCFTGYFQNLIATIEATPGVTLSSEMTLLAGVLGDASQEPTLCSQVGSTSSSEGTLCTSTTDTWLGVGQTQSACAFTCCASASCMMDPVVYTLIFTLDIMWMDEFDNMNSDNYTMLQDTLDEAVDMAMGDTHLLSDIMLGAVAQKGDMIEVGVLLYYFSSTSETTTSIQTAADDITLSELSGSVTASMGDNSAKVGGSSHFLKASVLTTILAVVFYLYM